MTSDMPQDISLVGPVALTNLVVLNCQPFRLQYTLLNFSEPDPGQPRTVLFSLTADMKTFTTKMHDNNEVQRMNYFIHMRTHICITMKSSVSQHTHC